ncbi:MAG: BsuBI/PstI family type II restriction endonuclease [Bacteroidota bacterium]
MAKIKRNTSTKPSQVQNLIDVTINILSDLGIPMEKETRRRQERTAMAFLALGNIKKDFSELPQPNKLTPLRTREIISFLNENFSENISSGSYDDIRRKDLKPLVLAGIVENMGASKGFATNDPTRRYSINAEIISLLKSYKSKKWKLLLIEFRNTHISLREAIERKRDLHKIEIILPEGIKYILSSGEHNKLQKAIIEDFLPRFTKKCEILYFGDTSKKNLHKDSKKLEKLGFFELAHDELPDIVAYDPINKWIFLIEAVHSSGPMSEFRVLELKQKLKHLGDSLIFVTAFLNKQKYLEYVGDIAWETEVWISDTPDHMIHFNGNKFLGPYKS